MSTRDGLNDTRRSRRERDIKQEDVDGKDGVGTKQPKGERQRSVHFEGDIPLVVIEIQMKDKVGVIPIFEFSNPKDLAQQFAKKNALDEQTRRHVFKYIIDEMDAALAQKYNKTGMVKSQSSAVLISQPRVVNEEKQPKQGVKYQGNVEDLDQPQPRKQPPIQQKVPESFVQQGRKEGKANLQNNERLKKESKSDAYEDSQNKDENEQEIRSARQNRNKGIYYYNEDRDEQKRNTQRTKKKDSEFEREQERNNADSQRGYQRDNNEVGRGFNSNGLNNQRTQTTEMVDSNIIQAQRINNKRNQENALQLEQQGLGRKRGQNNQDYLKEQEYYSQNQSREYTQPRQNNNQQEEEEEQEEEKEFIRDTQLKEQEGAQFQGRTNDEGYYLEERQIGQFKEDNLQKKGKTRTNDNGQVGNYQEKGKNYYDKQKMVLRDYYLDENEDDDEEEEEQKRNNYLQDTRGQINKNNNNNNNNRSASYDNQRQDMRPRNMNLRIQPDQNIIEDQETDQQSPIPTVVEYDNRKQVNSTNQGNRNTILKVNETVLENNNNVQGMKRAQNGQLKQIKAENVGSSYIAQINNPNETAEINYSQRQLPQAPPPNPLSTFLSPTQKAPDLSSYASPPINQQPYTSPFYQPSPYQQNPQNYQLQSQSPTILSTPNLQQQLQMQVIPQNLSNQTAQFLPQSNHQQLNPSKSASLLNLPPQFTFQSPNPQFSSPVTLQSQPTFQQPPQYYQYPSQSPMQSTQISQLPINQQPSPNDFLQQQWIVDNNNSNFIQNQGFLNNQQPQQNIQQISSSFHESQLRLNQQQQQLWYEQQYLQQSMQPYQNNPFQPIPPIDQRQSVNFPYPTKSNQGNLTPTRRRIFLDSSISNRSQPFSMKLPAAQGAPVNLNENQNYTTGIVTQSSQNYQPVQQQSQIVMQSATQKQSLIEIIQRRQEEEFAQRGIGKNAVVLQNIAVQEKAINPAQRMQPQEFEKTDKQLFIQSESDRFYNEESMLLPSPQGDEAMRAIQKCFARLDDRNLGRINLSEAQSLVSNLRDTSAEMKRELSRLISKASSSKLISSLDFSQFYCLAITDFPELVSYCKEAYDGQTSPQFQTIPMRPPSFGSTNQETSQVF